MNGLGNSKMAKLEYLMEKPNKFLPKIPQKFRFSLVEGWGWMCLSLCCPHVPKSPLTPSKIPQIILIFPPLQWEIRVGNGPKIWIFCCFFSLFCRPSLWWRVYKHISGFIHTNLGLFFIFFYCTGHKGRGKVFVFS